MGYEEKYNHRNGVIHVSNVDWCCVCFALVSGFLRVYITYSIGRRMNGREYENMPEINSIMAKEGRAFSTTLDLDTQRIKPQMKVEYLQCT